MMCIRVETRKDKNHEWGTLNKIQTSAKTLDADRARAAELKNDWIHVDSDREYRIMESQE